MPAHSLVEVQKFLRSLERSEMAALLENGTYALISDDDPFQPETSLDINLSPLCATAALSLPAIDRDRLLEALVATDPEIEALGVSVAGLHIRPDERVPVPGGVSLVADLISQRSVMIDVATYAALLKDVDDYYRARRKRIAPALQLRGLEDPVPFESLWDWHKFWSEHFPTYRARRSYVHELFRSIMGTLLAAPPLDAPPRGVTGWERVDRSLQKARHQLAECSTVEDFQGVGLLCRETLISLAQAVFDPGKHPSTDGVNPSDTDAKRMLEAYIAVELQGGSNEAVRRHAKAALALASDLVHARTADERRALLCHEATQSVVSVVAILAGRIGKRPLITS